MESCPRKAFTRRNREVYKLNQAESKALQADEDARHTGMEQLQNWGCMLRCEPRCGPPGFKPSPVFKNATSRYPDDSQAILESYRADDAYLVMDLINWWFEPESDERTLAHLFYAERETHSNSSGTLKAYNTILEKSGRETIGSTRMKAMLREIEVRVGTAVILCQSDDSWKIITRVMSRKS